MFSLQIRFFNSVLDKTSLPADNNKPKIHVDRLVAATVRANLQQRGALAASESPFKTANASDVGNSLFGQAFRQLWTVHSARLRPERPSGSRPHIAFEVKLRGEHAVGEAGPYRQVSLPLDTAMFTISFVVNHSSSRMYAANCRKNCLVMMAALAHFLCLWLLRIERCSLVTIATSLYRDLVRLPLLT